MEYNQSPASGFVSLLEIRFDLWCYVCKEKLSFRFLKDDGIWEIYQCPKCRINRQFAVR